MASSNPFRRKAATAPAPSTTPHPPSTADDRAYQQPQPLDEVSNLPRVDAQAPKKTAKKVRVQSPPPAPPSIPDSSSTIGDDVYAKPPTPIPRDNDPFRSAASESSDNEQVIQPQWPSVTPANPFSRTLETMEAPGSTAPPPSVVSPGRASMDVDAFKRLLMTGNSGLGTTPAPVTSPGHIHHGLGDGGSSTDTSSVSRQSLFEPIQEAPLESPRTSHEISEPDDDRRGLPAEFPTVPQGRKKPPPPSSRHGKLIKVELRDDPTSSTVYLASPQPLTSSCISNNSQHFFSASPTVNRSNSDLNKPLPPAPNRTSHESDRESIFDKEAAGKTPEPPSRSNSLRRKTPPVPPLARRQSQRVSGSKPALEAGRLSPKAEEESIDSTASTESGRPRAGSNNSAKAPPPPPSRRPASIRGNTTPNPMSPPSMSGPPPTPPARGSSKSVSGRPPSVISMDMSTNKRASMAPPPPPHRHGRTSGESGRRPSGESIRQVSSSGVPEAEKPDMVAEITKLQQEIDARIRNQTARSGS